MVHTFAGVWVFFVYWACCLADSDMDAGIHSHSGRFDQFSSDKYRGIISVEVCLLSSHSDWGIGRMDKVLCPEITEGLE